MKTKNPFTPHLTISIVLMLVSIARLFHSVWDGRMWLIGVCCFILILTSASSGYWWCYWSSYKEMMDEMDKFNKNAHFHK